MDLNDPAVQADILKKVSLQNPPIHTPRTDVTERSLCLFAYLTRSVLPLWSLSDSKNHISAAAQ